MSLGQCMEIADVFAQALGDVAGGRVLDVATGEGGFIGILQEHLQSYAEIVGLDASRRALETTQSNVDRQDVHLFQMDAGRLGFADESFDTVTVSASLHHLADVPGVLAEMVRLLRPGGHLVVAEMHSSGQSEPQRTVIEAHHWIADVDLARGIGHYPTLARQEIVDRVQALNLSQVACFDWSDTGSDPMDEETILPLEGVIDRYLQRAGGLVNDKALERRGQALRWRLREVGVQREPVLVVVGKKR
ncbi:MAG: methyltransferase domain-containing protein [Anaerolineae bacterium]|nr:MAG: methyltransferase domain-containing protein [Anaerolineae bacterium]